MNRTWNLATVVDNADPDKRRRLKLRLPKQSAADIDDKHLLWTLPAQTTASANFDLPDIGDTVLVLSNDSYDRWLYLPDKSEWQDLSDDDYATALIRKHKNVLALTYKQSEGWKLVVDGDNLDITYKDVKITTDGTSLTAKVKDVQLDTDGSKLSVSNASVNLKNLVDALQNALQMHTHTTATGPSGTPINMQDFVKNKTDFDNLLK